MRHVCLLTTTESSKNPALKKHKQISLGILLGMYSPLTAMSSWHNDPFVIAKYFPFGNLFALGFRLSDI